MIEETVGKIWKTTEQVNVSTNVTNNRRDARADDKGEQSGQLTGQTKEKTEETLGHVIDQQDTRTDKENRQNTRTDNKLMGTPGLMTEKGHKNK